ncbi:MAG: hypothetical protein JWM89_1607 [Acidimicrobiales bacterium]|nr:hypothetical protein [Acidimicrobiales bacterium]
MTGTDGSAVLRTDTGIGVVDLWNYEWAASRRPFLHPVRAPGGHLLTRDAPDDHPWHHGLWFTVKFVDADNFWEEMAPYGVLRHQGPPSVDEPGDGTVTISGSVDWIRPDRETVAIVERRTLRHVPISADAYAIDLDTTLVPATDVLLDRTEFTTWGGYGGFTVRGPADLVDTRLLLDDGSEHERVLGVSSRWLDLTGTVAAEPDRPEAGIALLDHPSNRRHPVPFYASTRADTYGDDGWSNFANAAFLWESAMPLVAGEELRIRHRALIHDGRWEADRIAAVWQTWAEG